jgi:hypothetical protein
VPRIIEYQIALQRLEHQGLVCNYFNGGAFGFPKGVDVSVLGWIAADDPTIRPQLRPHIRQIPAPQEQNMAQAAVEAWLAEFPDPAWIMPLSHWAFELDFGSKNWLPNSIKSIGLDPALLASRSDASPIEFQLSDKPLLLNFIQTILQNLASSDFMLAFPSQAVLCTIHHHKQLWWTSSDKAIIERISGHTV